MRIMLSVYLSAILLSFLPARVSAHDHDTQCLSNDGEWHILSSDPNNPNNIVIDGETFYILQNQTTRNKKTLTFKSDNATIARLIIVAHRETNKTDIDIYLSSETEFLRLQCKNR